MMRPGTIPNMLLEILMDGCAHRLNDLCAALPATREQIIRSATKIKDHNLMDHDTDLGEYRLSERGLIRVRAGFRISSGPRKAHGKVRRQPDSFRKRAWAAMRVRGIFTVGDIISDAMRTGDPDQRDNLRYFLRVLHRGGYVAEMPRRAPGSALTSPGFKRFRLIRDTGPQVPVYRPRQRSIMDFNLGEEITCP
jgi:hypothetical protein